MNIADDTPETRIEEGILLNLRGINMTPDLSLTGRDRALIAPYLQQLPKDLRTDDWQLQTANRVYRVRLVKADGGRLQLLRTVPELDELIRRSQQPDSAAGRLLPAIKALGIVVEANISPQLYLTEGAYDEVMQYALEMHERTGKVGITWVPARHKPPEGTLMM